MPDHFHGILFVQKETKFHLGNIIGRFKAYTNKAYCRLILHEDPDKPREGKNRDHLFWQHGYNDKILYHEGQLQAWTNYIHQNPYRLVLKHENPDLFRVHFNLNYGPYTFSSIGNRFLLTYPDKLQLQCSRSLIPEQIEQKKQEFLSKAQQGHVVISPAISPGEKAIMRAILNDGHRLIFLRENGFTFLSKPGGRQFMEACAAGNLLMLSPWEHHNDQRKIQRSQCLTLNSIAKYIVETPPPIIL